MPVIRSARLIAPPLPHDQLDAAAAANRRSAGLGPRLCRRLAYFKTPIAFNTSRYRTFSASSHFPKAGPSIQASESMFSFTYFL